MDFDLEEFLSFVENAILSIQRYCQRENDIRGMLLQSQLLVRDVVLVQDLFPDDDTHEQAVDAVMDVAIACQALADENHRQHMKGRPSIAIPEQDLALLLEHHFTIKAIADMFRVSPRTIRRRISLFGLDEKLLFSEVSDEDLDEITKLFSETHPHSGQKSLDGFLRGFGLRIQRHRLRESLSRVDPRGVQARLRRVLHRRRYSVCMPNSLWHIDGYHKLIRWRIVIHGGIDGFSRLPVFICASNNNRATTMLQCFQHGVHNFGLPSRVRCDRGGENVLVSQFMLTHPNRGPGRGSCISGRSVHNQRIERFWRDLFVGCVSFYYNLFYFLEDQEILDPVNNIDLFILHYIFLPRINHSLECFRETYSHHRLRTEHNQSPYQLWIRGMVEGSERDTAASQGILDQDQYGIDWNDPVSISNDAEVVEVPDTPSPVSPINLDALKQAVDPMEECDDHGVALYCTARTFMEALIS